MTQPINKKKENVSSVSVLQQQLDFLLTHEISVDEEKKYATHSDSKQHFVEIFHSFYHDCREILAKILRIEMFIFHGVSPSK